MLTEMLDAGLATLSLGPRAHSQILSKSPVDIAALMKKADWTCHVCGIRIPGFMEIDHLSGHTPSADGKTMRCICQFCHNLRHPVKAAQHGRFIPLHAPDIPQEDLNRLAWIILAYAKDDIDADAVMSAISDRMDVFYTLTGCDAADSLIEGVFSFERILGRQRAQTALGSLDGLTRFWPSAVLPGDEREQGLMAWGVGGFIDVGAGLNEAMKTSMKPNFEKLAEIATRLATTES